MSGEVGWCHDHLGYSLAQRYQLHNSMVVVVTVKSIIMLTIDGIILTFVCDDHYPIATMLEEASK